MEKNLTTGSVLKTVLRFSLPHLLSYFLQTLYGMADLFIIGQFNGVESTTAVSVGSQVMHMVTVMIVGLAMGSTVMIGQAVGAKKREQAARAIGNTATLFMALSVLLTGLLLLAVNPIVRVMSTPAEAMPGTVSYLTVCFIGIPFITAYNVISSVFRGMGDSKSPMYFIAIACAANIALDYLLIGGMGLGPAGAALGTTLSQTVSVAVALAAIRKQKTKLALTKNDFRPQGVIMGKLLHTGIPIALQDGFIQIAFIVITVFANKRGLNDAAAVGIVEKIISLLFLVPSSMLQTVSVLSAQNIGAGKPDRARLTLRYAAVISILWGLAACLAMRFYAGSVVGMFAKGNDDVAWLGSQYMKGYVWDCVFAGIHFSFSGYFCACGRSELSFLHNVLSILCVRVPLSYLAATYIAGTLYPMGLASPAGSVFSAIFCTVVFIRMERRGSRKAFPDQVCKTD